jgi:hypothetical protein
MIMRGESSGWVRNLGVEFGCWMSRYILEHRGLPRTSILVNLDFRFIYLLNPLPSRAPSSPSSPTVPSPSSSSRH